jgi:hypothetical protein
MPVEMFGSTGLMTHSGHLFIHLTRSIQGKPLCRLAGFGRALNRYRVLVQGKIDRQFVGEDIHAASHGWLMLGLRRLAPRRHADRAVLAVEGQVAVARIKAKDAANPDPHVEMKILCQLAVDHMDMYRASLPKARIAPSLSKASRFEPPIAGKAPSVLAA